MILSSSAALIYLLAAVPLGLLTVWTDLSRMKIPNRITDALLVLFIPLGLIALPFDQFLWQLLNPVVMFAIGLAIHAARLMGAGDVKFLIAASPYVMVGDLGLVFPLLAMTMIAALVLHRVARATIGPRLAPNWQSWKERKRFPLGLALGPCFITYLVLAATA